MHKQLHAIDWCDNWINNTLVRRREASDIFRVHWQGEKSTTRAAQPKAGLDRCDMEFTKMVSCSDSLSTSPFSIKNILSYQCEKDVAGFPRLTGEGFDDAACSIPRPIVSPVPYNPPPLMYPCASFGPPLHAPTNWTSIGMGKETVAWMPSTSFMTHQFFPGKCKSLLHLFGGCFEHDRFFNHLHSFVIALSVCLTLLNEWFSDSKP